MKSTNSRISILVRFIGFLYQDGIKYPTYLNPIWTLFEMCQATEEVDSPWSPTNRSRNSLDNSGLKTWSTF